MVSPLTEFLRDKKIIAFTMRIKFPNLLPDKLYIQLKFRLIMSRRLNLKHPVYFNDKLQWLKLYYKDPRYSNLVDKYEVRKYIAQALGKTFLIPLLGVWDHFEDIDFDSLPNQFILKCTHESGQYWVCRDKKTFDFVKTRKGINASLERNYYYSSREWPYKSIKPRIICEELIRTPDDMLPFDYKFFCFNGIPDCVMVCIDRETDEKAFGFYDRNWKFIDYYTFSHTSGREKKIPRPQKLSEMFDIAAILSKGFPFVRVDLYNQGDKIYFGELTFFPQGAFDTDFSKEAELELGDKIDLTLVNGPGPAAPKIE